MWIISFISKSLGVFFQGAQLASSSSVLQEGVLRKDMWVVSFVWFFVFKKTTSFGMGKVLGKTCRSQVRFGSWAKHAPAAPWNTPPEMAEPSGIDSISYTVTQHFVVRKNRCPQDMAWHGVTYVSGISNLHLNGGGLIPWRTAVYRHGKTRVSPRVRLLTFESSSN